MSEQEILENIAKLILEASSYDGAVNAETRFREDLGMDSLTTIELITASERAFDVQIPYEELDDFSSVGELAGYVAKLKTG